MPMMKQNKNHRRPHSALKTESLSENAPANRTTKRTLLGTPVKHYKANEIKEIRRNAHMTQKAFAYYLCVSTKTVEAWERGTTAPPEAQVVY